MLAAACNDAAGSDDDVASAGGDTDRTEETGEDLTQEESMLAFSDCMRENGVEDFPDPGGGPVMMDGDVTDDPDFEAAMDACQDLLEDFRAAEGSGSAGGPDLDDETAREFADCMRENGVEDFPDPSGDGMSVTRDLLDDPDFEEASEACAEIHEFGLGGGGR